MFDLTGRQALVTGASGGIGGAIARALHCRGAGVVLSGTRVEPLEALAKTLGNRVHVAPCDLADPGALDGLVRDAQAATGGIDILVNNAGMTRDGLAMRMKDEDWRQVLEVNLTAAFRLSRACLRPMIKARQGRIVNIASVVGISGNAGQANYAASKAGMIGMSKALAREVAARGVTVNCVAPGFILSPMTEGLSDEQRRRLLDDIPTGQLGRPEDVAFAVVYLTSSEASYVTGETLHVNGGMAMT